MNGRFWTYAAAGYLVACLLLGGASAAGAVANALLQLAAAGLILAWSWRRDFTLPREARGLVWIAGAFLLVNLFTLVPLPASVWGGMPFRNEVVAGFQLIGMPAPALALSLSPPATIWSLLALLPPIATFLLVAGFPTRNGAGSPCRCSRWRACRSCSAPSS